MLITVTGSSPIVEITFSDLGFNDISVPGLWIVNIEANFSSELTGRANITAIIYADIGESSVTMEIMINNDSSMLFLENGVTKKTWTENIEETNNLRIRIINVGTHNATIYSNSTIRIFFETSKPGSNTAFHLGESKYFWITLLIGAYALPFIITFIYKKHMEKREGEEEIPVIAG